MSDQYDGEEDYLSDLSDSFEYTLTGKTMPIPTGKEGLLALEVECESLNKETEEKYFAELLSLVVNGTDSILVTEYALNRYFAANLTGNEVIVYLIYSKGILMIQTGEHPMVVEKIFDSMLPENVKKLYMEKKREKTERLKKSEQEDLQNNIDSICSKNPEADEKEIIFYQKQALFLRKDQIGIYKES